MIRGSEIIFMLPMCARCALSTLTTAFWPTRCKPVVNQWVSSEQRGLLKGRIMLSNVLDLEHAAQLAALKEDKAAILLLDFKAAFPSTEHAFLWRSHHMIIISRAQFL